MRFDLRDMGSFSVDPSPDSWHHPSLNARDSILALPVSAYTLGLYTLAPGLPLHATLSVPKDARAVAVNPAGTIVACVLPNSIVLVDPEGRLRRQVRLDSSPPPTTSIVFAPDGDTLFLTRTSGGETLELIALDAERLDVLATVELEGDSEGSHYSTWLSANDMLQVEINAGPNGFMTNFVRYSTGLLEHAMPPHDTGEGLLARLLPDNRTIAEVTAVRARMYDLESRESRIETRFEALADCRPGTCGAQLRIPLCDSDHKQEWQLLVLNLDMVELARIPIPRDPEYAWFWCEGPVVLAESRRGDASTFRVWEVI